MMKLGMWVEVDALTIGDGHREDGEPEGNAGLLVVIQFPRGSMWSHGMCSAFMCSLPTITCEIKQFTSIVLHND